MISGGVRKWASLFGVGVPPSTGLREALQWLMMARLGVLYAILSVVVLQQIFRRAEVASPSLMLGYGLLAASFAFNLANAWVVGRLKRPRWSVCAVHILFDAGVTSAWIALSGSTDSLFALLYLVQILISALILYQKGALVSSLVAVGAFGVVSLVHPTAGGVLAWGVYSALFLTLGVIGGYLSEELLRTTESLREKSRKMERLMDVHERILADLPTGVLTVDDQLRVNFINPVGAHLLNRAPEQIVGQRLADVEPGLLPFFRPPEDAVALADDGEDSGADVVAEIEKPSLAFEHHRSFFVAARLEKGTARLQQTVEIGRGAHKRLLRGDVAELDPDAGLGRLLDEAASGGRILLFQDVTKVVHLEEKLKQNEKLAAVGQLAAGIAHEIRNPLAGVSASIEMLKGALPQNDAQSENQRLMDIAIREIDRLNNLITEFLDFVKPEKFRFESVDLSALLSDLLVTMRESRDVKGRLELEPALSRCTALANAEKLKQVALNLLVNAVQAMGRPGKIRVGCEPVSDQKVRFWVEDEGCGMDEETLSHLYEPFFTTKPKGTGLGLATAYKIVEAHHGEIRVTSTKGVGTRFEVYLQSA